MFQSLSKVTVISCRYYIKIQCVRLIAGRLTQASDVTDQYGTINEYQLIFDEVKAYKNNAKFLGHLDIIPAGCAKLL